MARGKTNKADNSANIAFEAKLWLAADKLRSNMDAAEYKHVVLGLIFLKYISDAFEEHHATLLVGKGDYAGADPEDPDDTKPSTPFGFHPEHAGRTSRTARSSPRSARSSMMPWSRSSATIRA